MNFQEGNTITGFTTDIAREIMKRLNIKKRIELWPWPRVYKIGLEQKNVILFTAARTEEREKLFYWVGPIVSKKWLLYAVKDKGIKIRSLDDAKKVKIISVMRDDAREKLLLSNNFKNIFPTNNHIDGLRSLLNGRIDLWASSDMEAPIITKNAGINYQELEAVFTLKEIKSYILISRKTRKSIVREWQNAYKKMIRDGGLQKIAEKWSGKLNVKLTGENGYIEFK